MEPKLFLDCANYERIMPVVDVDLFLDVSNYNNVYCELYNTYEDLARMFCNSQRMPKRLRGRIWLSKAIVRAKLIRMEGRPVRPAKYIRRWRQWLKG